MAYMENCNPLATYEALGRMLCLAVDGLASPCKAYRLIDDSLWKEKQARCWKSLHKDSHINVYGEAEVSLKNTKWRMISQARVIG